MAPEHYHTMLTISIQFDDVIISKGIPQLATLQKLVSTLPPGKYRLIIAMPTIGIQFELADQPCFP
ncbi:MAG: hypothetical protein GY862_19135 [Gammaproteobacteria bacterium]|nr:hypothetical protein [Gammaproteobacteria bacterium]